MSKKINFSDAEKEVIQKYFNGEITAFGTSEEDMKTMSGVIKQAENLMHDLEAYDEASEDMIKWFWEKYNSQNEQ